MRSEEVIYREYLLKLKAKLIDKYNELGLRASGKYEKELEEEIINNKLIMWGAFHSQFMESGRDKGKFPPRKAIEDWIEVKQGLPEVFREKKKQFAFLIARKIAKQGIVVPNEFNAGEVVSSVVNSFLGDDLNEMLEELGIIWLRRIQSDVVQLLKVA